MCQNCDSICDNLKIGLSPLSKANCVICQRNLMTNLNLMCFKSSRQSVVFNNQLLYICDFVLVCKNPVPVISVKVTNKLNLNCSSPRHHSSVEGSLGACV